MLYFLFMQLYIYLVKIFEILPLVVNFFISVSLLIFIIRKFGGEIKYSQAFFKIILVNLVTFVFELVLINFFSLS